jgi:hypothetical protein
MVTFWWLLDTSAHARGGFVGHGSCHYNCGYTLINAFAGIVVIVGVYGLAKLAFQEANAKRNPKSVAASAGLLLFCICVLIASLFLGPVVVIVGIIAGGVIWYKVAQSKG